MLELQCQCTAAICYTAEDVEAAFKLLEAKSTTWSNCESPPCNISKMSLIFSFLSEAFNWPLQPVHGAQLNFQHGSFPAHVDECGFLNPTSLEGGDGFGSQIMTYQLGGPCYCIL